MPEIEYPPTAILGESRQDWERRALNPWRMEMKRKLLVTRGNLCERGCGRMATDLDEPIVPRADMRGLSLEQRRLAFSTANMELACSRCNRESPHDRAGAWERACKRFGLDTMIDWYASLGLRVIDRRFT